MDKNDIIFCVAILIIVILLIAGVVCSSDLEEFKGVKIFPMPMGGKIYPIIL